MPTLEPTAAPHSTTGTAVPLDKEILEIIPSTQYAEQGWIDKLRMLRKVNSIWHLVAQAIYPDSTDYISEGQQNPKKRESWESAFHLERHMARALIPGLRNPHGYSDKPTVRYIIDILQAFPATLDIQVEAMRALQWQLDNIDERDQHEIDTEGVHYATTLYSTLSTSYEEVHMPLEISKFKSGNTASQPLEPRWYII